MIGTADRFTLAILDRVAAHAVPIWDADDAERDRAWALIPVPGIEVTVILRDDAYEVRSSDLTELGSNLAAVFEVAIGVITDLTPHVTREEALFRIRERLTMLLDLPSG